MRFIYLVSCLGLVLLALVAGTYMVVSAASPSPTKLTMIGFDVCDKRPCFLGITPGLTPWVQVPQMLKKFNIQRNQLAFYISLGKSINAQIANNSETHVNMIIVTNYAAAQGNIFPSAGEFLARYGLPCSVQVDEPVIRLIYPYMSVSMTAGQQLTPRSPVVAVVQLGYTLADACRVGQNATRNLKWSGFASLHRYKTMLPSP